MYIDDMGYDFEFENRFKKIGSCVDFSDYDENDFDYIDDFQMCDFENVTEFENENIEC